MANQSALYRIIIAGPISALDEMICAQKIRGGLYNFIYLKKKEIGEEKIKY